MSSNDPLPVTSGSTAMLSMLVSLPMVMVLGVGALLLWCHVFLKTSSVISDGASWPSIRGQVTKVIGSTMLAMFVLLITSIIYFLQDQTKSIYAVFVLIALSACFSYSALATSSAN